MDSIIELLQKHKEYTVTEIGGDGEKVNKITNYRAINSKYHEADVIKEIATADIVSVPPDDRCTLCNITSRLPAPLGPIFSNSLPQSSARQSTPAQIPPPSP